MFLLLLILNFVVLLHNIRCRSYFLWAMWGIPDHISVILRRIRRKFSSQGCCERFRASTSIWNCTCLEGYSCTFVHVYRCYVCFEDFVVYKYTKGFTGYSRTRDINQGSNEKYWSVVVFGKPVVCTRGACGSVLFTLPLYSSGYVDREWSN